MIAYRELILYKMAAELRSELARAYLGVAWWVAEPILYMAVFYVVFAHLLERGGPGFVPLLLTGLVVWRWFDGSVRGGMNALLQNKALMQQVYVPKLIFPLILTLTNTFKFLIVFALLLVFLLIYGVRPTLAWTALPLLMAVEFLFLFAGSALTAILVPLVPDSRVIINNLMTLMLFMSGIFFRVDTLPDPWQNLLLINPMATLIDAFRKVLLDGAWPDWTPVAGVALFSAAALAGTARLYAHYDLRIPKLAL